MECWIPAGDIAEPGRRRCLRRQSRNMVGSGRTREYQRDHAGSLEIVWIGSERRGRPVPTDFNVEFDDCSVARIRYATVPRISARPDCSSSLAPVSAIHHDSRSLGTVGEDVVRLTTGESDTTILAGAGVQ